MEGFLGEITPGLSISSSFSRQRRMGRTAQGEGMHEEKNLEREAAWSVCKGITNGFHFQSVKCKIESSKK